MSNCRFCHTPLEHTLVDLGLSPVANAYVSSDDLEKGEGFYPLHTYVCQACFLVQIPEVRDRGSIFNGEYAYFSSFSTSWLKHCEAYAAAMTARFGLGPSSKVVEVASNDGYLLQYFVKAGIPVLGVEPAANCAAEAERKGVPTVVRFFGEQTARDLAPEHRADLIAGNNVFAHVPDINDFVEGFRQLLKPEGVVTLEFPHLLNLIQKREFDTIYHEHYSYLSFLAAQRIFRAHGLRLFDVDELPTHGGSLRIYGCLQDAAHAETPAVAAMLAKEKAADLDSMEGYRGYEAEVRKVKRDLLKFLITAREEGKRVAAYGAPAKGNTLLNYCGVRTDLVDYTVDRSPHKQGRFLPGTRIPIHAPERIFETRPDYVLILPWNLKEEIMEQMSGIREWGGRFVVPIPELKVLG